MEKFNFICSTDDLSDSTLAKNIAFATQSTKYDFDKIVSSLKKHKFPNHK